MKRAAGAAALEYVAPSQVIGVGSGTTVGYFIEALGESDLAPKAAVATSAETRRRLEAIGVEVVPLSQAGRLAVYIDGADEVDPAGRMIKGAGGAHTQEKIVASASRLFVCVVDATKVVERLGLKAPVPLEVLPQLSAVALEAVAALGGTATVRDAPRTPAGNLLVDVCGLDLADPDGLESQLDSIPGVVECGIFAHRRADVVIVGEPDASVRTWRPASVTPV